MIKATRNVSGLGNANRRRRTREIQRGDWQAQRLSFFQSNVRFAASAKATRTALDVTQAEVAEVYGVSQGTVCGWESGKYSWPGGAEELAEYFTTLQQLASK